MKRLVILGIVCLAVFIGFVAVADAYEWHIYNGHSYTLTNDWGTWAAAEQEAVTLGGHLVTINDDAENIWLTNTFKDTYTRSYSGLWWANGAWIGYYYDVSSSSWKWISGEPVTYYHNYLYPFDPYYCSPEYDPYYCSPEYWHAYLHLAYHSGHESWGVNTCHDWNYDNQMKGIIEVPKDVTSIPSRPQPTLEMVIDKVEVNLKDGKFEIKGTLDVTDPDFANLVLNPQSRMLLELQTGGTATEPEFGIVGEDQVQLTTDDDWEELKFEAKVGE